LRMVTRLRAGALFFFLLLPPAATCPAQTGGGPGEIRKPFDTVGFASTRPQMDSVVKQSEAHEASAMEANKKKYGFSREAPLVAALCPHDDYVYAGPVYVHVIPQIQAPTVILFGVSHHAKDFNLEDKLVFDAFRSWSGPYGPVPVSFLREAVIQKLDPADFIVSDEIQAGEHSVEAIVPFLQYYNREVQIVSILVPYMRWERLNILADKLADALYRVLGEKGLRLGRDVAFVCSVDCVHYGDQAWPGGGYAPFGTSVEGYEKAVAREHRLLRDYLVGKLSAGRLRGLYESLVDPANPRKYRVTWCGRFSVPFGLDCVERLSKKTGSSPLKGVLLRYGTSVGLGELEHKDLGIGVTAPSNLHHWVGYAAVGYR
jgi:AmmeMemoRadiSam system protein B